jgi:hypothetical protein
MDIAEHESFYEEITTRAVAETVEKLLRYPFGFHGDTGIRDFLYARLHAHGGQRLEVDDPRPGCSTLLLQAEHLTLVRYRNTGQIAQGARFDLALCAPPSSNRREDCYAENLTALFAFELGKNKPPAKVIDPQTAGHAAGTVTGTSDLSKLYRELRDHELRQGWAIEFYDSRMRGAQTIQQSLDVCRQLPELPPGKKLVAVFVEFARDGARHHVCSNDPQVQAALLSTLGQHGIDAGSDPLLYAQAVTVSEPGLGGGVWRPSASVEEVFGESADFANRIIRVGVVEESGRASGYVNLSCQGKRTIAQLHPHGEGIALVLRSADGEQPVTMFAEIPVTSLAGHRGTNNSWLDGTGAVFKAKGPAVAYLIPSDLDELADGDAAWRDVARLLAHAKASA